MQTPPLWDSLAAAAGLTLSTAQHERLSRYLDLLIAGNASMNLTRVTDRDAAEVSHVADSLTVLPLLPAQPHRLADVGSGGGIPGLILAIARPDAQIVLIESTGKKAAFLRQTAADLGLANVRISAERAEIVARSADRESFDAAIARAVAPLQWLIEYCLPLVRVGGRMIAMKGPRVAEELPLPPAALRQLGGAEPVIVPTPLRLPGSGEVVAHVVVDIRKIGKTAAAYPRHPSHAKTALA